MSVPRKGCIECGAMVREHAPARREIVLGERERGRAIAFGDRTIRIDNAFAAEVFENGQPIRRIFGVEIGRRKTLKQKPALDGKEGNDIFGQMRDL